MSKVLVTGGTGFIGSHLSEKLVALGHKVTILDNVEFGNMENIRSVSDKINLIKGNITDVNLLEGAIKGNEYIFHLAANNSVNKSIQEPFWSAEQNIMGAIRLLEIALKEKVRRVIFSSSTTVYGYAKDLPLKETMPVTPASPYALEKATGENYMKLFSNLHDIDAVSLRYFNVFGPRQNASAPHVGGVTVVINQIHDRGRSQLFGDGKQTRDMIYVEDIVKANILAMEKEVKLAGAVFNICTGKSILITELHNKISQLMGVESSREYLPLAKGNIIDSKGDPSLAKKELSFKAEVDLDEGLKKTIEWSKKKYNWKS
jgi:UDP-glucose 4-epimerase